MIAIPEKNDAGAEHEENPSQPRPRTGVKPQFKEFKATLHAYRYKTVVARDINTGDAIQVKDSAGKSKPLEVSVVVRKKDVAVEGTKVFTSVIAQGLSVF